MVTIKLNSENSPVNVYKNKPTYGYIHFESVEIVINGAWMGEKKRSTLMRGEVALLAKFVQQCTKNNEAPGRISVNEFIEDAIPANYLTRLDKNVAFEEAIQQYLKKIDKDGPELTIEGKRIVRFTDYDMSGKTVDTHVQHDNVQEVKEYNDLRKLANASLPQ
jgi:hypothetical protein